MALSEGGKPTEGISQTEEHQAYLTTGSGIVSVFAGT